MKVTFYTVGAAADQSRRVEKFKTIDLEFLPPADSVYYDESAGISYQINTVFFTKDRVSILITPQHQSRHDLVKALFPKRTLIY